MNSRKIKSAPNARARQREINERRELERGVRHNRRIVQLCRQLRGAIVNADDALRGIGRIAVERDMPTAATLRETGDDLEPEPAGTAADAND